MYDGPPPVLGSPGPLAPLGDALVSVRRAPRSTPFVVKQLPATAGLVGKSRHEIENTLGGAMSCQDAITAPCKSAGQAFYSFYKLPEGQRGGGPELLLSFDSKSICTAATFAFTR